MTAKSCKLPSSFIEYGAANHKMLDINSASGGLLRKPDDRDFWLWSQGHFIQASNLPRPDYVNLGIFPLTSSPSVSLTAERKEKNSN